MRATTPVSVRWPDRRYRLASPGVMFLALMAAGSCSDSGQGQTAGGGRGRRAVVAPVAVAVAAPRDLARRVTLTGPVEPIRVVEISARTAGSLVTMRVVEGDRVRAGQVLAELDERETRAQLGRARAVLTTAEATYRRTERLLASAMVTDVEFEQARAAYETARSDVDLWETRLDYTRVVAPTRGVITAKYVEEGGAVSTNQRMFDIADDSLMVIRVQMSELDVVRLEPGTGVTVELDAYPGVPFAGTVRRVFPSADAQTRLVPVEVAVASAPGGPQPKPGFLARVHFDLDRRHDVLVVPVSSVGNGATGEFVFLVDADTLVRQAVTTGLTSDGMVEVADGLAGGERVVSSPLINLQPGERVRVTSGPDQPPAPDSIGPATGSP